MAVGLLCEGKGVSWRRFLAMNSTNYTNDTLGLHLRSVGSEAYNNGLLHFPFEEDKGRCSMETIVLKPDKFDIEYDKENDVLYISAGKPREADDSIEPQEGVVIRTRKGELVGITIIGLHSHLSS